MASKKNTNPLYVVTNKGQDIEEANGLFDMLVKRFNLGPVLEILEGLMQGLASLMTNFAMFTLVKELMDQIIDRMMQIMLSVQELKARF